MDVTPCLLLLLLLLGVAAVRVAYLRGRQRAFEEMLREASPGELAAAAALNARAMRGGYNPPPPPGSRPPPPPPQGPTPPKRIVIELRRP